MFNNMMQALYNEKGASLRIEILHDKPIQDFIEAHASVLDSSFKQVEMSDIMRRRLQRSDYIFSGLKTFHELNEAFPSLLDDNGNRKSFERFLNDVQKINKTYNQNYLRAEYNFASASAEMAARWEQFMDDGDRYYLQYRTAADGKVRPEHAALHGVTLPIDDPFWEQFYPPNGWNCRCSVTQVRKSKYPATPHNEAMALGEVATQRDTRQMFRFNPGKEQKTFPNHNPYTISRCKTCNIAKNKLAKGIPDNDLCAACRIINENEKDNSNAKQIEKIVVIEGRRKAIESMPIEEENIICNNLSTGKLHQANKPRHRLLYHCFNSEELEAAVYFWNNPQVLGSPRISILGENKDLNNPKAQKNIESKKRRGVCEYIEYQATYKGERWLIKTERHKRGFEQFYSIKKEN